MVEALDKDAEFFVTSRKAAAALVKKHGLSLDVPVGFMPVVRLYVHPETRHLVIEYDDVPV